MLNADCCFSVGQAGFFDLCCKHSTSSVSTLGSRRDFHWVTQSFPLGDPTFCLGHARVLTGAAFASWGQTSSGRRSNRPWWLAAVRHLSCFYVKDLRPG